MGVSGAGALCSSLELHGTPQDPPPTDWLCHDASPWLGRSEEGANHRSDFSRLHLNHLAAVLLLRQDPAA